jgi:hypothetical protein
MRKARKPGSDADSELSPPNRGRARAASHRHLRSACNRCGSTTRPQAHHVDGNWRNNRAENIETLCAPCHSDEHRGQGLTVTPLPRKAPRELAHAAAWAARRLLEATVAEGSGGLHPTPRGRLDWYGIKRRFAIPVEDNENLEKALLHACARLELLPVYHNGTLARRLDGSARDAALWNAGRISVLLLRLWLMLPEQERPPRLSAEQWYAEHKDRIAELLRESREVDGASRHGR